MAAKKKETTKKEETSKRPKKLVVEEVTEEEAKEEILTKEEPAEEEKETEVEEKKKEAEQKSEPKEGKKDEEKKASEKREEVSAKKVLLIAIPIAIFTGLLSGGIFYYVNSNKGGGEATPTPTPIAEETPTPTPAPEIERGDLSLQVLNGSGISGKAGEVKAVLEELGYDDVDTGNADSYDFEETVISLKEGVEEYLDMLIEDLSEDYTVSEDTEKLDEDSDFDVVITVGTS